MRQNIAVRIVPILDVDLDSFDRMSDVDLPSPDRDVNHSSAFDVLIRRDPSQPCYVSIRTLQDLDAHQLGCLSATFEQCFTLPDDHQTLHIPPGYSGWQFARNGVSIAFHVTLIINILNVGPLFFMNLKIHFMRSNPYTIIKFIATRPT